MPTLYLNAVYAFDDLTSKASLVYVIYAAAFVVVLMWIIMSLNKAKGLVNHHNAVALRSLLNFFRTADHNQKQTDELLAVLTRNRNDVSMLFYMYCRIHSDFSSMEFYLDYKTFKKINKKAKPWGFTTVVAVTLGLTLLFSFSHFVNLQYLFSSDMDFASFSISLVFPLILFLAWLGVRIYILMKYQMYWVEFENKFRKVNGLSGSFFASQEEYYEEFSEKILNTLSPIGGVKYRVERIIAKTEPSSVPKQTYKPYTGVMDDSGDRKPGTVPSPNQMPKKNLPQTPYGAPVARSHPESDVYQSQSLLTQQLMQMMMQQSMQQTQVVQRALSSQQALANSVVQQNIMALRLEAQQTSLMRPDILDRIARQTSLVWSNNEKKLSRDINELKAPKQQSQIVDVDIAPSIDESVDLSQIQEIRIETPGQTSSSATPGQPGAGGPTIPPKAEQPPVVAKLTEAFKTLSPPQKQSHEPDPMFVNPERERTHLEKRLGEFYTAKAYIYD